MVRGIQVVSVLAGPALRTLAKCLKQQSNKKAKGSDPTAPAASVMWVVAAEMLRKQQEDGRTEVGYTRGGTGSSSCTPESGVATLARNMRCW